MAFRTIPQVKQNVPAVNGAPSRNFALLHYLGGSHRTWAPTLPYLDRVHDCLLLDTPGFGDAVDIVAHDVEAMADYFDASLRASGMTDIVLTGHSMTGKVALVIAARRPDYLHSLILVTPSPPWPQPITKADRKAQLDYRLTRQEAENFVDKSSAGRMPDDLREVAIADAQHVNLDAWRAWAGSGMDEDWTDRIGRIDYPTLLILGGADDNVPAAAEHERRTLPFFSNARIEVIAGQSHLLPMQVPERLASLMLSFASN